MRTDLLIRREVNFRSLEGLRMKDGRRIRPGLLYRSGGLYLLSEEEKDLVRSFSLNTILDLRQAGVRRRKPDPDLGADYAVYDGKTAKGGDEIDFTPAGFGQTGQAAQKQYEQVLEYYVNMPFGYDAFHVMFDCLLANRAPFLIHCAKGKDRTGVAAMAVLIALGASEDVILQDYLLTNLYRKEMIQARMEEGRKLHPDDEGYLRLMFLREGVTEEVGKAVLNSIRTRCGSTDRYMEMEYGWTKETIEHFRNLYLE